MKETKDWGSIPFGYTPLRSRYEAVYKDGRWIENGLVGDAEIKLTENNGAFEFDTECGKKYRITAK